MDEDTDGDGLSDNEDDEPNVYNELKNYFIAYDNPGRELYYQAYWMMDWAYDNQNVEIFYLHTINDFIDCWNNQIPSRVNSIHLYLHGTREKEIDTDAIDFFTPFLQFYEEEMVPGYNDFNILKTKYVETKVYLNSCHGGTEDKDGFSVAKRIAEKISNGRPVEALKNDYVDYFSYLDFEISSIQKSEFDQIISIGLCWDTPRYINYNLFPRRHLGIGTWIEVTAEEDKGEFIYHESEAGNKWEL